MAWTARVSNELWWLTAIGIATLIVSIAVLVILVRRGGRSRELAATIDEVRKVGQQVENMRAQSSTEHGPMQDYIEWTYNQVKRMMARFGFIADRNFPEPPVSPRKPKATPDDTQ